MSSRPLTGGPIETFGVSTFLREAQFTVPPLRRTQPSLIKWILFHHLQNAIDLPYSLVAQRLWIMGSNDLARLLLCLFCHTYDVLILPSQGTPGTRLDNHDSEQRRRRLGRPDLAVARCDSEKELHRLIRHVAVLMSGALRAFDTKLAKGDSYETDLLVLHTPAGGKRRRFISYWFARK